VISTIIFDAEGIVVNSEAIWDEEQKIFLGRRGYTYEREKVKHLVTGKSLKESIFIMGEIYGFSGNMNEMIIERKLLLSQLFYSKITFIDGFQMFFDQISSIYNVCIATSLEKDLLGLIEHKLELLKLFGGNIFSIDDVNCISKPNPDVFLYAANKMQVDPLSCLVIEDSPHGIEAAKRARMKSIALTTTYEAEKLDQANFIFNNYKEIDLSCIQSC
jgi:beta-phosphoglucomutase-like phosphatase (HAD superfamily)